MRFYYLSFPVLKNEVSTSRLEFTNIIGTIKPNISAKIYIPSPDVMYFIARRFVYIKLTHETLRSSLYIKSAYSDDTFHCR